MTTYFPYSHIIQVPCDIIRQCINRHFYFGEWSVCDSNPIQPQPCMVEISEIYY